MTVLTIVRGNHMGSWSVNRPFIQLKRKVTCEALWPVKTFCLMLMLVKQPALFRTVSAHNL